MGKVLVVVVLSAIGGAARSAQACSSVGNGEHTVNPDEALIDVDPPLTPDVGAVEISRGRGPRRMGCSEQITSCDDVGFIAIEVNADDDRTGASEMGYRVGLADGALPGGLSLPDVVVRPFDGVLHFSWIDGASDTQELVSFTLRIIAVDLGGNESEPVEVEVFDGGASGGLSVLDVAGVLGAIGLVTGGRARRRRM